MADQVTVAQEWLTTQEVAALYGFSVWTVRAAVRAGQLPASRRPTRPGGRGGPWRIRRVDADAWLSTTVQAATLPPPRAAS